MSESLTLRTLQLSTPGHETMAAADLPGAKDAGLDFQAVLARQFGTPSGEPPGVGQAPVKAAEDASAQEEDGTLAGAAEAVTLQTLVSPVPVPAPKLSVLARSGESATGSDASDETAIEGTMPGRATSTLATAAQTGALQAAVIAGDDARVAPTMAGHAESADAPVAASMPVQFSAQQAPERKGELTSPAPAPVAGTPLDDPVAFGRRGFSSDLGDRVLWMATNNRQVAELRVDPPHLGPIEVRLSIDGEQANVSLVAAHAGVREALQSSIPRLQDMIHSIGLELGNVSVGGEAQPGSHEQADGGSRRQVDRQLEGERSITASGSIDRSARRTGMGLVDTYA